MEEISDKGLTLEERKELIKFQADEQIRVLKEQARINWEMAEKQMKVQELDAEIEKLKKENMALNENLKYWKEKAEELMKSK